MFTANELAPSFLLAVSLSLLAGIGLACCTTPTATVDGLKEQIDIECPIGSHYPKVMQFLDSKGIRHSPYKEDKEYDLSIGDYRILRRIGAQIPRVERKLFTTWTIYISFDFDLDGRLTDYKVRKSRDDP
jgi:hypothetical protein